MSIRMECVWNLLQIHLWFDIERNKTEREETRMTTSISSEALSNYKKDIWKMKVNKRKSKKKTKNHEIFQHNFKIFTFLSFLA